MWGNSGRVSVVGAGLWRYAGDTLCCFLVLIAIVMPAQASACHRWLTIGFGGAATIATTMVPCGHDVGVLQISLV